MTIDIEATKQAIETEDAIDDARDLLERFGYEVAAGPETARLVADAGLAPNGDEVKAAVDGEAMVVRVHELRVLALRLRSFQRQLDVSGADRDLVARVAGSLLDVAEDLERRATAIADVVRERAAG